MQPDLGPGGGQPQPAAPAVGGRNRSEADPMPFLGNR